jgi:DNA-binding FadR family transcriptional regulator
VVGLTPGDKLPSERELMKRLAVGRSSLREAIKGLSTLGIIEVAAGSGMYVASGEPSALAKPISWGLLMSERSTRDVIDTRRAVEVELAGLAAERATQEDLAAINERLCLMRASADDLEAQVRFDLEFHLAIAQAAHSNVLYHVMETLRHVLRVWFREISASHLTFEERIARHTAIYDAIRAHEVGRSREVMAEHLGSTAAWLMDAVPSAVAKTQGQRGQQNGSWAPRITEGFTSFSS